MKKYYVYSTKLQDYLEENGLLPISYEGKTAIYQTTNQLLQLLDSYYVNTNIFRGGF